MAPAGRPRRLPPVRLEKGTSGASRTDSLRDRRAAEEYFEQHGIRQAFSEITEELFVHRPGDPYEYMVAALAARAEQQALRANDVLDTPLPAGEGVRLLRVRVESRSSSGKRAHQQLSSIVPERGPSLPRMLASAKRKVHQALDQTWASGETLKDALRPSEDEELRATREGPGGVGGLDEVELNSADGTSSDQSGDVRALEERVASLGSKSKDLGGLEQWLMQQLGQLRRMGPLLCEHDKRARELGIDEQELERVRKAVKMTPGPTPRGSIRVLTWNLLADGLSDDGFLLRHVLREDSPDAVPFGAMLDEVSTTKRERGDMQALKAKYDTQRSRDNHAAVMDWPRRWLQIRALIAATAPDIVALQELDHMADAEKELGELGYTCKLPGSATHYKPIHATLDGAVRRQDTAYMAHLRETAVAFAPKTYSNCRKFGLKSKRASADDDGVAIFWRKDVFNATAIDFLSFNDAKRNQVSQRCPLQPRSCSTPTPCKRPLL